MTIQQREFADILSKLNSIVPKRSDLGVQGILIRGNEATASSYDLTATAALPGETDTPFVLSDKAVDMISKLPNCPLEINVDNNYAITISADGIKCGFSGIDPDMFQVPSSPEDTEQGFIDADILKNLAGSVLHAASVSESRGIHTGVLFEARDGEMNIVALDGHRVAWAETKFDGNLRFVVPKASLERMLGLKPDCEVSILCGKRSAIFAFGGYTIHTRLLEGEFLDYRKAWPEHSNSVDVYRKELLDVIRRVMVLQDKIKHSVKMVIEKNMLTLEIKAATGRHREEIHIDGDADFQAGFNPAYLSDALNAHSDDTVSLAFSGPLHPTTISSGSLRTLVLPVRLG